MVLTNVHLHAISHSGADPEIFERGGPEAIIYQILERGGPKSVKMAFECLFQSSSYKSFANIPPNGGNPPLSLLLLFNKSFFIGKSMVRKNICLSQFRGFDRTTQTTPGSILVNTDA